MSSVRHKYAHARAGTHTCTRTAKRIANVRMRMHNAGVSAHGMPCSCMTYLSPRIACIDADLQRARETQRPAATARESAAARPCSTLLLQTSFRPGGAVPAPGAGMQAHEVRVHARRERVRVHGVRGVRACVRACARAAHTHQRRELAVRILMRSGGDDTTLRIAATRAVCLNTGRARAGAHDRDQQGQGPARSVASHFETTAHAPYIGGSPKNRPDIQTAAGSCEGQCTPPLYSLPPDHPGRSAGSARRPAQPGGNSPGTGPSRIFAQASPQNHEV